ncbi:MAG: hypothetical protein UV40_C0031G0001, partial [Parcubacteria group bacterium GW2011_GWA1_42_7]
TKNLFIIMTKLKNNFPDQKFLAELAKREAKKTGLLSNPLEMLKICSGASLNWIADYLTDKNISWEKKNLAINDLYLTGTNPEWNKIIIQKCEHSPFKLREFFKSNPADKIFKEAKFIKIPILVRFENGKYKVLDGMHRTIAAIRENRKNISVFVAETKGSPRPECEAHIIYDLLRAYQRSLNRNKKDLIAALRFIRKSYANTEHLLKTRFGKSWLPDEEIQTIIQDSLKN